MPNFIDLTRTIDGEMPGVQLETAKSVEKEGWNARNLHLYSHSGTHIDAPVHFGVEGPTIDQIPVSKFMTRTWMVSVEAEAGGLIEIAHLQEFKDKISAGESIVIKTGWSKKYGTNAYRDLLPRISAELADWLVEKKINIIGVEPPSVADVNNLEEVTLIHKKLLSGGITIVEGLTNLEAVTVNPFLMVALPLKIKDGDGAPARVIAIEN